MVSIIHPGDMCAVFPMPPSPGLLAGPKRGRAAAVWHMLSSSFARSATKTMSDE